MSPAGLHAHAAAVMAEEDRYPTMRALFAGAVEGRDYRIHHRQAHSDVAIVAPHGGCIEPGTFELADAIAGTAYNFYCFEAIADELHVTSTHFDDPICLRLVESSGYVVTVHGYQDGERTGEPDLTVAIGGLDKTFGAMIRQELESCEFGIGDSSRFPGVDPRNICNRGRRGAGVQLETSRALRSRLIQTMQDENGGLFSKFTLAIDRAIRKRTTQG
jgi:phage replication-related protein YjqB (UPF0714/DUF867 family)